MLNVRLNREPITRRASIAAAALFVAVAVLVAGFGVSAQSFSTVSGSIVDQFTRALPGVTLALLNPQNQSKYEIKSDRTGHYEFVGVPPGNYVLTAELPGFATLKREGVVLAGQAFQQNITMQVGTLQETITVVDDGVQRPQVNSARERPRVSPGRLRFLRRHAARRQHSSSHQDAGRPARLPHGHASGHDRARGAHRGRRVRGQRSACRQPGSRSGKRGDQRHQRVGVHADVPGLPADRGPHEGARELRGEVDKRTQPLRHTEKVQSSKFS